MTDLAAKSRRMMEINNECDQLVKAYHNIILSAVIKRRHKHHYVICCCIMNNYIIIMCICKIYTYGKC